MKKNRTRILALMLSAICLMSISLTACTSGVPPGSTPPVSTETTAESTQPPTTDITEEPEDECPFELFVYNLPNGYKKPNEQAGTVTEERYTTYVYDENGVPGEEITATLYVYTPYGYDSEKQYDILYLMHGGGESQGYWFGMAEYADGGEKYSKAQQKYTTNIVDNMIANGDCGDVIIVTPTFTNNDDGMNVSNFRYELKNDIMPMVEAKYSTHAGGDVSTESLISSRDHRAFAGFSMGSMTTFFAVWDGCFEYFAYLGNYSGCDPNEMGIVPSILEKMNTVYSTYGMKYWFNGTGTLDTAEQDHLNHYAKVLEGGSNFLQEGENLAAGDNCIMVDKPGYGHAYNGWIVDLYNSLLVFFKAP